MDARAALRAEMEKEGNPVFPETENPEN